MSFESEPIKPKEANTGSIEEINSIPESETNKLLVISKIGGGQIAGVLLNPPIKLDKPIILAMGNTSRVKSIQRENGIYTITTVSGSKYSFNPEKAVSGSTQESK